LTLYLGWSFRRLRPRDRAVALFERFARKLDRARVAPRVPTEGPLDYGTRAARTLPQAAPEILAITQTYLASRYEPRGGGEALDELRRLVRAFRPAAVST
jgi:hypothetical protein